jgi:hypothetical protein
MACPKGSKGAGFSKLQETFLWTIFASIYYNQCSALEVSLFFCGLRPVLRGKVFFIFEACLMANFTAILSGLKIF